MRWLEIISRPDDREKRAGYQQLLPNPLGRLDGWELVMKGCTLEQDAHLRVAAHPLYQRIIPIVPCSHVVITVMRPQASSREWMAIALLSLFNSGPVHFVG